MMWVARFAVVLAVSTTLWFNASYAFGKADALPQQLGLVAAAVTIDLAKCSFLTVAALLWHQHYRLRAVILLVIWPWLFLFSTFCGYAAIAGNRSFTSAVTEGQAQERARAQSRYDQAVANLKTAQASPLWSLTAACTASKLNSQRAYCDNIKSLQQAVAVASNALGPAPTVTPDPELATLKETMGISVAWLAFLVSALPALLIELASSLGSYALGPRMSPPLATTPLHPSRRARLMNSLRRFKKPSVRLQEPSHPTPLVPVVSATSVTPAPIVRWATAKPQS